MAQKTYRFKFNAQKAEFYPMGCAVAYGKGCTLAEETRVCTWAEAQAYLPVFSAGVPGPHRAFVSTNDRVPPGYYKTQRHIDKKGD